MKFCTDEECVLGHDCNSGCGNDFDCPCLTDHPREEDSEEEIKPKTI